MFIDFLLENSMKKLSVQILCCILALCIFPVVALEVDREELNTVGSDTVVFINYTGPQNVIQTKSQIAEIGSGLGRPVADDPTKSGNFGNSAKYQVIHAVDPSQTDKLDAVINFAGIIMMNSLIEISEEDFIKATRTHDPMHTNMVEGVKIGYFPPTKIYYSTNEEAERSCFNIRNVRNNLG